MKQCCIDFIANCSRAIIPASDKCIGKLKVIIFKFLLSNMFANGFFILIGIAFLAVYSETAGYSTVHISILFFCRFDSWDGQLSYGFRCLRQISFKSLQIKGIKIGQCL